MANIFANDTYAASDGVPKLQGIANHIKNCSDAFDSATIQLASIIQPGQFRPMLTSTDAATLNSTFVPSTQAKILRNLNTFLDSESFYEAVNNNPQMRIVMCHWVGDLARQNDIFLGLIVDAAPSPDFSSFWTHLQSVAASGYQEFLQSSDGFQCGNL
ncbi:hypothetical protein B0H11DRAFT_1392094 [Mycena galericulata]|nr:hypothetical protein B0H11DRAFT_1392094 [Mycena galericulata]